MDQIGSVGKAVTCLIKNCDNESVMIDSSYVKLHQHGCRASVLGIILIETGGTQNGW